MEIRCLASGWSGEEIKEEKRGILTTDFTDYTDYEMGFGFQRVTVWCQKMSSALLLELFLGNAERDEPLVGP